MFPLAIKKTASPVIQLHASPRNVLSKSVELKLLLGQLHPHVQMSSAFKNSYSSAIAIPFPSVGGGNTHVHVTAANLKSLEVCISPSGESPGVG